MILNLAWHKDGYLLPYQDPILKNIQHNIFVKHTNNTNLPNLLLVHGFPTSSYDWEPIWSLLSQHFRLITLDMIGFGYSDKPQDFAYSVRAQADIVEYLLDHLSIKQVHILAHDFGDTVVQELIARENEAADTSRSFSILSTLLLNGGIFPEVTKPILTQKLLISPLGSIIAKAITFKSFKRSFDHICTKPIDEAELRNHWALIQSNRGDKVFHKLIRYMQERKDNRDRWAGALQDFTKPMRLINGEDDPISGDSMITRYQQIMPTPDVVRLQNVGHYPQIEATQAVYDHAVKFWNSHHFI